MTQDEIIETKAAWGKTFVEIIDPTKENHVFRVYFEQPQRTEPVCPECKAGVLYECVACSSNNYPPQRTWVGLTDEEFNELYDSYVPTACYALLIEEVEAKLKEKNHV